jgi:hypothetical protein
MSAVPEADMNGAVTGQLAVGSRGFVPFSWVGLFQEKTEQNQSRIFVFGAQGRNAMIATLVAPFNQFPDL